jgi:hypothetical protein
MAIARSALVCFAMGFLIVALGLGHSYRKGPDLLLRFCLSTGFGVGVFSIIFFVARSANFVALWRIDLAVLASLLGGYVLVRRHGSEPVEISERTQGASAQWFLTAGSSIALFVSIYSAVAYAISHPYGDGWDSLAIWNLHARFLYRGGVHWGDGFTTLISWSHPDYPLLLPAAIAHFWTILGRETTAVPTIIGPVFTFATAGLLFAALDILVSRTSAMLGAMALLCTPFFIELGTWQYADIPLSFFFLSTIVLLHLHDDFTARGGGGGGNAYKLLALAGFAAGFGLWTKNEGVLFLCGILVARFFVAPRTPSSPERSNRVSQMAAFVVTLLPVFCVLVFFKHSLAPRSELFSDASTMLHKLREPARYGAVLKWYGKDFLRAGRWLLVPIPVLMAAFYWVLKPKIRAGASASVRASAWALGLTLAGYFFIYLVTPYEIYWHLRFSLDRLCMQIWPSAIFVFFARVGSEPLEVGS